MRASLRIRKRKSVYFLVGPLPHVAGYVVGPLALSRRGRRWGWRNGRPGRINLVGLIPLSVGATLLGGAIVSHYQATPEQMKLTVVPEWLATGGVYRLTRNPMYLGGAAMQAGWAILLGSVPVAGASVLYVLGLDRFGIPFEERLLHRRFGESYDLYRERVPRWVALRHT